MKTVYLVGPITGVRLEDAQRWRDRLASRLLPDIKAIQPMGGENRELLKYGPINAHEPDSLLSNGRALTAKDRFYVQSADVIYARFLGASLVSKFSIGECFWADAWRKPIILGIEPSGNPNDFPALREMAGWHVDNDEDAEAVIRCLLEAV